MLKEYEKTGLQAPGFGCVRDQHRNEDTGGVMSVPIAEQNSRAHCKDRISTEFSEAAKDSYFPESSRAISWANNGFAGNWSRSDASNSRARGLS
jgi:hypothetical protein